MISNEMYTNNPDDAEMYTNNPDDEEQHKNNQKKLFFDDDDNNDNNDNNDIKNEIPYNDNPYLEKKSISESDNKISNLNIEVEKQNNLIQDINKEKKEIELIEKEEEKVEEKEELNEIKIEPIKEEIKENKKEENPEKSKHKKKEHKKVKNENQHNDLLENSYQVPLIDESNNNKHIDILENHSNSNRCPNIKKLSLAVLFGQIISLLCVGNGFCVEEIQKDFSTPLLINACYYLLLFIFYIFYIKFKIKKPKWIYIILSLIDTQANFINVYIFSITKFKYPFIINILSTIWSVVFTIFIIKTYKYLKNHIIGILLSIIGVFASFLGTFKSFEDFKNMFSDFNNDIKGLLLCILVSILYGLNSVLIEKFISSENDEIKSYCTWLGIFGFAFSLVESFIPIHDGKFELQILSDGNKNDINYAKIIIFWILAAVFLAAMTALSPFYIQKFSATMYNISLAFTIIWSYVIESIFIVDKDKYEFYLLNILYFVGFVIIIIGTVIFSLKDRIKKHDYSYS